MGPRTNLDALVQAFESQLDTIRHYYDRDTGDVVMVSEEFGEGPGDDSGDDLESDRYLLVPPFTTNDRFQIMEDFVESLPDETMVEELNQALIGKGAFQRFEEVLQRYPRRFEQWRRFRADKVAGRAREWLREHGIEPPS
ncbi:MAG TPA: UPF0158 family protein [Vicinamibacteria bacterium]|jgi:hypothetical protein